MNKDQKFSTLKPGQLKKEIAIKFRSITRFCIIAGLKDYNAVIYELNNESDPELRLQIFLACQNENNIPLAYELTPEQKHGIKKAIYDYLVDPKHSHLRLKTMKDFCKHFQFNQTWLSRLLSTADYGASRTNTSKIKQLLTILNLSYE